MKIEYWECDCCRKHAPVAEGFPKGWGQIVVIKRQKQEPQMFSLYTMMYGSGPQVAGKTETTFCTGCLDQFRAVLLGMRIVPLEERL